jgi:hypothetical protein
MASEVSICNQALGWLGQTPIVSLDDASVTAQLCKANYDEARLTVLEEGVWSFAQERFRLGAVLVDGGDYNRFHIPAQVLKVREVYTSAQYSQRAARWVVEGRYIVTNLGEIYVIGTVDITPPSDMTAGFRAALAARLAADLAIPITQNNAMQASMWALYEEKLARAMVIDAVQGKRSSYGLGPMSTSRYRGGRNA